MGYETRLLIGRVGRFGGDKKPYFLRDAELEMSKCGHLGHMGQFISHVVDEKNPGGYKEVNYSEQFEINREKVFEKHPKVDEHLLEEIIETAEGWESETNEDRYGTPLRAVPIQEVYDALQKQIAQDTLDGERPYRRFLMAEALLKSFIDHFEETHVILYGH